MKISEALLNADDEQIAELWDTFIEQATAVLNAHVYRENLTVAHFHPTQPDTIDLDGLCEYMKALREYQIAKDYYDKEAKRADKIKFDALKNLKPLVFGVWIKIDDYGIRFGKYNYSGGEGDFVVDYELADWDNITRLGDE